MSDQKPILTKKSEFEEVLSNYHPSDDVVKILRSTNTAYISGPTASGKNTLIDELNKTGNYHIVLSNTTRPRRPFGDRLENDGEFYWHITEDEFLEGLRNGDYVEAAIIHGQQVSGGNYKEYLNAREQNKIAITDIEVLYGAPVLHRHNPGAHYIFILPPQFEEWIERLTSRGSMSKAELIERLKAAQSEIVTALGYEYYVFLISSDLNSNVVAVHEYVRTGKPMEVDQKEAKDHAEQLLIDIRLYLESLQSS